MLFLRTATQERNRVFGDPGKIRLWSLEHVFARSGGSISFPPNVWATALSVLEYNCRYAIVGIGQGIEGKARETVRHADSTTRKLGCVVSMYLSGRTCSRTQGRTTIQWPGTVSPSGVPHVEQFGGTRLRFGIYRGCWQNIPTGAWDKLGGFSR